MNKKFFLNWAIRIGSIASVAILAGTLGSHASSNSATANANDSSQTSNSTADSTNQNSGSDQQSADTTSFFQHGGQGAQTTTRAS